jgi:hypothetical protein
MWFKCNNCTWVGINAPMDEVDDSPFCPECEAEVEIRDHDVPKYDDVPEGYLFRCPSGYNHQVRGRVDGLLVCRHFIHSKKEWAYSVIPPASWTVTGWVIPLGESA